MADDDEDLARQVREQQEQLRELQAALAEAQRLQTSMEMRAEEEKKEDEETFDPHGRGHRLEDAAAARGRRPVSVRPERVGAVSYTHLTLPTILLV